MVGREKFAFGLVGDEVFDFVEQFGGGVFEHHFGLVFEGDELIEGALLEHFTLMDDANGVADFLDLFEEVGAEKDGDAFGLEVEDEVANLARAKRVNAGGRLVEDEEAGRLDEGLGEADALEHAFGVASESAASGFGEGGEVEEFFDAVGEAWPLHTAEFAVEFEGFAPGEVFVEVGVLGEVADVFAGVGFEGVFAKNLAGAAGGGEEAEEGLHGGRFARTIGTDEPVDLPRVNGERDLVHCSMGGALDGGRELFDEVFDFYSVFAHKVDSSGD